jgi:hypothetical protein
MGAAVTAVRIRISFTPTLDECANNDIVLLSIRSKDFVQNSFKAYVPVEESGS